MKYGNTMFSQSQRYGGGILPTQKGAIEFPQEHTHHQNKMAWVGILNILTYLGEMALLFVPGVNGGDMVAIAAQVGIGLAGASARAAISIEGTGKVNAISEAIDFGSAFLPMLNEGIGNLKLAKSVASETTQKYFKVLVDQNKEELANSSLKVDSMVQDRMMQMGEHKVNYYARIQNNYEKRNELIQRMYLKEHHMKIKQYEKLIKRAKNQGEHQAQKYYEEALQFYKRYDPLVHPKKLKKVLRKGKLKMKTRRSGVKVDSSKQFKEYVEFRETQRYFGKGQYTLYRNFVKNNLNSPIPAGEEMFHEGLTGLSHAWFKEIINPWKRVVENKHGEMDEFLESLWKKPGYETKRRKTLTSVLSERDESLDEVLSKMYQRNSKNHTLYQLKKGKYKPLRATTKSMRDTMKRVNERAAVLSKENQIIESISRKMAAIKPSFKTSKGYIFKNINRELDALGNTGERVQKFLIASTKQKERKLSYILYKRLFKRLLNKVTDLNEKATLIALFQSIGKIPHKELLGVFNKALGTLGGETEQSVLDDAHLAMQHGIDYYYKSNWYAKLSKKYHFGNSMAFRYKTFNKHGKFKYLKLPRLRNLINPMTLARAIPDSIYQTFKKWLDHRMSEAAKLKLEEAVVPNFEKFGESKDLSLEEKAERNEGKMTAEELLEEDVAAKTLFAKNGGILIPSNRYLVGFKILPSANVIEGEHLVMFMFNKIATMTKSSYQGFSKNREGKPNSLGVATDYDIEKLTTMGVGYYWTVGKEKGWFINRGGRQGNQLIDKALSASLSLYLGFLPTNDLRNIITLASSTEYETIRWLSGKNEKHLGPKMFSTGFRTMLNRIGRLAARYTIPKASAIFIGMKVGGDGYYTFVTKGIGRAVIGKEFQRYLSMSLALTVRTNSSTGKLEFGLPSMSKFENRFLKTSERAFMRQGFTRHREVGKLERSFDFRGHMTEGRKSNRYYTSKIRQMRSAKRRLSYVSRIKGVAYSRAWRGGTHLGQIKFK